jgi:multidrug efflux system membrane fusion protein
MSSNKGKTMVIKYMREHYLSIAAGLIGLIIVWLAVVPASFFSSRGRGPNDDAIPVLAAHVERRAVDVDVFGIGTVQATNSVVVKTQVDGRLIALSFNDGQDVKAGDVLARIDPTLYQAQYDQAAAKKQQDEALLANARRDLERYLNLAKTEYAPQQQADTQRALVRQLEAQIAADEAARASAEAYLSYTTITAPISGRTGIRNVDAGNLLKASDSTGIVTINQIQPIAVTFTLPQQKLADLTAAMAKNQLRVVALDGDQQNSLDTGVIDVIDNQIDQSTGTIKLKASFANQKSALWPGQFVNLRLTVKTLERAITVPTPAIQRGAKGAFVYVIDAQNNAHVRTVTIAYQTEMLSVIDRGVDEGEMIVTNGFNRLNDGALVRIDQASTQQSDVVPPQRRQRGERGR